MEGVLVEYFGWLWLGLAWLEKRAGVDWMYWLGFGKWSLAWLLRDLKSAVLVYEEHSGDSY